MKKYTKYQIMTRVGTVAATMFFIAFGFCIEVFF